MKTYKFFIIVLLLFSCDNPTSSNIPNELPDDDLIPYNMDLRSSNSGDFLNKVNIDWDTYTKSGFIEYTVSDVNDNFLSTITDINQSLYTVDLNPAVFEKIYLNIILESNTITDSIEIFTRDLNPITNFSALAIVDDWSTSLEWTPTLEADSIFSNYKIYRLNTLDYSLFNNLNDCDCEIAVIDNRETNSYIDAGDFNLGEEYFYLVQVNTINGDSRSSKIKSNLSSIEYSCSPMMNSPEPSASITEKNKITLNWNHSLDENTFYEIQIWRSASDNIDPLNSLLLTTITDFNKTYFSDYYNIGDGAAWFYKIKLIDVHGDDYTTDLIMGNSHP